MYLPKAENNYARITFDVTGMGLEAADGKLLKANIEICFVFIKRNTNTLHQWLGSDTDVHIIIENVFVGRWCYS